MSINGKLDEFTREDLLHLANQAGIKKSPAMEMLKKATSAVNEWEIFAEQAEIPHKQAEKIRTSHRSYLG